MVVGATSPHALAFREAGSQDRRCRIRLVFSPSTAAATDLLSLPWELPLAQWTEDRIVEIPQRGCSRPVVRFVAVAGQVVAVEELPEDAARQEYRVLRRLHELGIPAVEVIGVGADRPDGQEATRARRKGCGRVHPRSAPGPHRFRAAA
jgi:hypothetical protein